MSTRITLPVQAQSWQQMNPLLMDGREEKWEIKGIHCRAILVWKFMRRGVQTCWGKISLYKTDFVGISPEILINIVSACCGKNTKVCFIKVL